MLVENGNFGQKKKFWRKMEFSPRIEILAKKKFCRKMEIFVKNRNFGQPPKLITMLVKTYDIAT